MTAHKGQAREGDGLMATSQMTLGMKLEGHAVREQLDSFTAWWTGELQVLMPSAWHTARDGGCPAGGG